MTATHGLQPCYVRGARGRRLRPVLVAGNLVDAVLTSRTDTQLAQGVVELAHSRGPQRGNPAAHDLGQTYSGRTLWQNSFQVFSARFAKSQSID